MHITSVLAVSLVFQRYNILHWPMMQWRLLHILYAICQPPAQGCGLRDGGETTILLYIILTTLLYYSNLWKSSK